MLGRLAAALLCTAAPAALSAQQVNLTSPDQFISVDGEIIGFNGVMLRVQTLVGPVSVPASEVICYGDACLDVLANNDFGLTADQLAGVVATPVAVDAAPAEGRDLTIAFASPVASVFFTSFAGGVAGAQLSGSTVTLPNGTTLTVAADPSSSDIVVQSVSLAGEAEAVANGPSGWLGSPAGLTHQMLGLDAFAVQMSPSTGLATISADDLSRVLAGEVSNWSQIGGANLSVLALRVPETSPVFDAFTSAVMAPTGRQVGSSVLVMGDEAGITASVNQFPGSIAVVSAANANPDLTVPVTGSCGIAVAPTPFNIASGDYPLISPIMATYGTPPSAEIAGFFDAAASDGAQTVGETLGLLGYSAVAQDTTVKNQRLNLLLTSPLDDVQRANGAVMFPALLSAQRLSSTFIGGTVSGPEAAWNRAMMVDLAEALTDPAYTGREVVFVGLGSSINGSQAAVANAATAAAAMQAVFEVYASALIAEAGLTVSSNGFGNIAPATCLDGQAAGTEATRVEVWVR